jgi:hypothetical protein
VTDTRGSGVQGQAAGAAPATRLTSLGTGGNF